MTKESSESSGVNQERSTASSRATACVNGLERVLRAGIREGGPNAKAHIGDLLRIIEAYQTGKMDGKAGEVTGPFYQSGVQ